MSLDTECAKLSVFLTVLVNRLCLGGGGGDWHRSLNCCMSVSYTHLDVYKRQGKHGQNRENTKSSGKGSVKCRTIRQEKK